MPETTASPILNEQQQSKRIAQAIGALCPNALFCVFQATADGRKLPHSKTGVGVSDQTPKADLYNIDEVFEHELQPSQFWGLYMHEPVYDCFSEFVLTILDVDMKRSTSPSDIRIKQLGAWAKTNDHLTELSHSKKGRHVIFLAKPDPAILPKYKLIDRQEIEVFGQPNSPKKSVMLTGFDMTTDALNSKPVELHDLINQLKLEPDDQPIKHLSAPNPAPKPSPSMSDLDRAAYALSHISPDLDYAEWIMLGQALHDEFGDAGEAIWHQWSSSGSKYQGEKDIHSHWKSFHQGNGVSIGTLIHMAKQHGYTPPTPKTERKTAVEDFISQVTNTTYTPQENSSHESDQPVQAPNFQPIPERQQWDELDYSLNHLPAVRYLIPKFLAHGFWILAGQPGVGKTSVLCSLMMLLSKQQMDGCTIETGDQRKVIIVTEDAEQVQRTLFGYVRQFQLDPQQITQNIIIVRARRASLPDLLLLKDNIERHTINPESDKPTRPLLILDTANATLDLDNENDNSEVGAYIGGLKSTIYTLLNTSIVLVTHLNKQISRTDSDAMARGASAFTGDATGTMVVFMDEDGTRYLKLIKRRYEPEIEELKFTTTTFTAPAITDDGEFIEQVCRVMVPEASSELERRQDTAERADEIQAQRIRKKVDEAITFVLNVINEHPEGVVMRKGSNASRTPPADLSSMFALNWDDIYQAVPGSNRSDVKRMVSQSVFERFCADPKNNAWNRLEA